MPEDRLETSSVIADYERWLGHQIPLVVADVEAKHRAMAGSALRFLRGTYFLWLDRVASLLPDTLEQPAVPCVGDLHVENFGTWRDHRDVRRWGVNDLDELGWGSWQLDLLRLATSAAITPKVALTTPQICATLLDVWLSVKPGSALRVDASGAAHLRALLPKASSDKKFYAALSSGARVDAATLPREVRAATRSSVPEHWSPTWHVRVAGTGSLGHRRLVAVGDGESGTTYAREVKLLGPSDAAWAHLRWSDGPPLPARDEILYGRVGVATRGAAPMRRVDGWQVRRLAPDVQRIDLAGLGTRASTRLLRSMAQASLDVHGTDHRALSRARAAARRLPDTWLQRATETMAGDTMRSFEDYADSTRGK